jgi:hypothetical protein
MSFWPRRRMLTSASVRVKSGMGVQLEREDRFAPEA